MVVAGSPVRFLLVEDDPGDVLMITEALDLVDPALPVDVVGDGQEALDFLRLAAHAQLPDVILLDLNMPRLDGRQLLALLKVNPQFKQIPIVVLSTSRAPDDIAGSYDRHANAYITKPTDLDTLTATVQQIAAFLHPRRPPADAPTAAGRIAPSIFDELRVSSGGLRDHFT